MKLRGGGAKNWEQMVVLEKKKKKKCVYIYIYNL